MSSLSFKNRASNYLRNMQIKAKQKLLHAVGLKTNNEDRARREQSYRFLSNKKKEEDRSGPANVWEKAKQRGKALTQQAEYMRNYAYQPLENQTFKMNKHNSNTRNNFNAKKLAQKKAPGGMAVWGGRKGNTRRNRKNRRGTRKN